MSKLAKIVMQKRMQEELIRCMQFAIESVDNGFVFAEGYSKEDLRKEMERQIKRFEKIVKY